MLTDLLIRTFIRDPDNLSDSGVRTRYGVLSSMVGIVLNLLISIIKLIAGALSGSIAILSDAFNNLSDAGSSVLNLIGFKLAAKKPHPEHPFGHGRLEYVTDVYKRQPIYESNMRQKRCFHRNLFLFYRCPA